MLPNETQSTSGRGSESRRVWWKKRSQLFEQLNAIAKRDRQGHAACIFVNIDAKITPHQGDAWLRA